MKNAVIALALLALSCSDSDKFSGGKSPVIQLRGISSDSRANDLYLYEDLRLVDSEESVPFYLDYSKGYLSDYFWIIDNDTVRSNKNPHRTGYGEHFVKLVLIDAYGDTLSDSIYVRLNQPLMIELLSPIYGFSDFSKADSLEFRYKISGVDSWEQVSSFVYVSTDENSLWKEENILEKNILRPPLADIYFWGVKAFTEQDSASSTRCIGKFC
jgi:hypothetical protein